MALRLYTYPANYRAWKALVAAQYCGVQISVPPFEMGKDNKTDEFRAKNPLMKVPVLETPQGCIFESNAIARYVARLRPDADLFGHSFFESGLVDQWLDFSANELEAPGMIWIYPILGYMKYDKKASEAAKADVKKAMSILDDHLRLRTFMVGHRVTLADIVLVSTLCNMYHYVFDPAVRAQFPNVTRWFLTCVHQPQFAEVIGEVELCTQEAVPQEAQKAEKKEKEPKKEKQAKPKKEKEPKEEKKKEPEPEATGGDDDEEEKPKPKKEKVLSEDEKMLMAQSPLELDAVKRLFSNNPVEVALEQFFQQFDANAYSMWTADYKFNDENQVFFMTCNLLGGFMQRLEEARKFSFGTLNIKGKSEEEGPFRISSTWLFKNPGIPNAVKDCPDAEYYTWTKLDLSSEQAKTHIREAFAAATIDGLPVLERRMFK